MDKLRSEFFSRNAFYNLGLTTFSGQKDILRRSKEITARLKIDDVPIYDGDLPFLPPNREINSVKEAVQDLSNPKARLKNHFFWLELDDESRRLLRYEDYTTAIKTWDSFQGEKSAEFYARKNTLLLKTLRLYITLENTSVRDILNSWKALLDDKKYWKAFEEKYFTEDEIGCSPQIFKSFAMETPEHLSNIFAEISELQNAPSVYKEYTTIFNTTGLKVVSNILTPVFEKLNEVSEKLEAMNVSEDGILDDEEKRLIAEYVDTIEDQIGKIDSHGLKEDSTVKTVRDRAADAIRTVVLDMHNNLAEMDHAEPVLRAAIEVAGTEGEKQRISRDLRVIQGIQSHMKMLAPLAELFKAEKFDDAYAEIEKLEAKNTSDSSLLETLLVKKKECVLCKAAKLRTKGMDEFGKNNFPAAEETLTEAYNFLDSKMNLFELNEDFIRNKILAKVKKNVEIITVDNVVQVEEVRTRDVTYFQEEFDTRYEGYYLIMIYDFLFYGGMAGKAGKLKGQATRNVWVEKLFGWGILLAILFAVFRACSG